MPEDSIAVYARIRESSDGGDKDISITTPKSIRVRELEFHIDHAFDTKAEQKEVYPIVGKSIVDNVVEGYNGAILAYGQTGSGKTFTMLGGENARLGSEDDEGLGIVPRACGQLFKQLPAGFTATIAYVEVYNDAVNDMYAAKGAYMPLREYPTGHVEPEGLNRKPVSTTKQVMEAVAAGDKHRVVAAMAMNPRSSRGHGLILVDVFNANGEPHARLTLVDLAGMESSKKSAAVDQNSASAVKQRQIEARSINQSLLALSSCVNALASKGAQRIPFRDSKLTRLLQSSLGGNCKAAFVVTLRSEKQNAEECMNVLKFAQKAKAVQATVVKVSETRNKPGDKKMAEELEAANAAVAQYHSKLAQAEKYSAGLMAEVQALLKDMKDLQKESDASRAKLQQMQVAGGSKTDAQYVATLERRVAVLEEENRVLRQRDIFHRIGGLQAGADGEADAPKLAGDFKPGAMTTFDALTAARIARINYHGINTTILSSKGHAHARWLGIDFAVLGRRRASLKKIYPAKRNRALNYKPKKRKYSKKDAAAITIQRIWRGWLARYDINSGYGVLYSEEADEYGYEDDYWY